MKKKILSPANLTACCAMLISPLMGEVQFTFENGETQFDGGGIGASVALLDTASNINVTLSTVDIKGQGDPAFTLASSGEPDSGHTTFSNNLNALGVNSAIDVDPQDASQNRDFNPGEAWTFQFDVDVTLDELDFSGWTTGATAQITVSSPAFSDIIFDDDNTLGGTIDLLSSLVPANTPITLEMTSDYSEGNDTGVRLAFITVIAVPPVNTGANLVFNGGDGGLWDFTSENFLDGDVLSTFTTGDNVTFINPGAVLIESSGVTAGTVSSSVTTGSVPLQGGALNLGTLSNSAGGTLTVENTTNTNLATISGGRLEVANGASLSIGALGLSGNSEIQVLAGGDLDVTGAVTLGDSGGSINIDEDLTLGNINNNSIGIPLRKDGAGSLTLTDGLGEENTGPVALSMSDGEVIVTGTEQINVGAITESEDVFDGLLTFDGVFTLDGPVVMLHGSTVTGDGSINVINNTSVLQSRFNRGPVSIEIPIILNADLMVGASAGNSILNINNEISGSHNVSKIGNGEVRLNVDNTYTGNTSISAGLLSLTTASLNDFSSVSIGSDPDSNSILILSHGLEDVVGTLFIEGVAMPAGTYGSSLVTAVVLNTVNDERFAGEGYLTVLSGPSTPDFNAWVAEFSLLGGIAGDDDQDGLLNSEEYAFGLDPTNAGSVNTILTPVDRILGTFTYTRRNPVVNDTRLVYTYSYSTNLEDWNDFTLDPNTTELGDNGDPVETVTVTLPPSLLTNERLFVQVTAQ